MRSLWMNRGIRAGMLLMLGLVLFSCKNGEAENTGEQKKDIKKKPSETLSRQMDGLWISKPYLDGIAKDKSVYKHKELRTQVLAFQLYKDALMADTAVLYGFTDHEGGYETPLKYDGQKKCFVNDMAHVSEFSPFPDPFDLKLRENSTLEMYFTKSRRKEAYRKCTGEDLETELRRLLLEGSYQLVKDKSEIHFESNGKVSGFRDFKCYEVIYDFGLGVDFDAIILSKTSEITSWAESSIYKFEWISGKLFLQELKANWETMEHQLDDTKLLLKKK